MTLANIQTMLNGITGFSNKVTYYAFPEGQVPSLPFICWLESETNNFSADGEVYAEVHNIDIELYAEKRDTASEELIETALKNNNLFWQKSIDYISTERCFMTTYSIQI